MTTDKILWGAMVVSTFIYAAMIYMIAPNPERSFEASARQQMTLVVYCMALAAFAASNFVPKLMRGPARLKMIVGAALAESCAIFGLVGAFVAHDWRIFVPTWILSLIGMWRVYPGDEPMSGTA